MDLADRVSIPADVMVRQLGEELVILDLASGTYFGLDEIGARIWSLMEDGRSLREVCDDMVARYEVQADEVERDVLALARDLCERGLINRT